MTGIPDRLSRKSPPKSVADTVSPSAFQNSTFHEQRRQVSRVNRRAIMSSSEGATALDAIEADNRAVLYKARWDKVAATEIVPQLVALLDSDDRDILLRTLGAFVTIGPLACDGAPKIVRLLCS